MHQSQALYIQIQEDMFAVNIGDKTFPKTIVNPLHPNISMHILHTVLFTFPMVLTKRIFSTSADSSVFYNSVKFDLWEEIHRKTRCLSLSEVRIKNKTY